MEMGFPEDVCVEGSTVLQQLVRLRAATQAAQVAGTGW